MNIRPALADSMEEITLAHPPIDFLRRYTKLYEIAHHNFEEPAWIMVACDLNRPIAERRPLMVDVMKEILGAHPAHLALPPIARAVSLEEAASLRDLCNEQAAFLRDKYPLANEPFARGLTSAAEIVDYPIGLGPLSDPSPLFNERYQVLYRQHTLRLIELFKNIRVVVALFLTLAKLFDVVWRDIEASLDAHDREQQTREVENELHDWYRDRPIIEGSSNHAEAFDRDRVLLGGLA